MLLQLGLDLDPDVLEYLSGPILPSHSDGIGLQSDELLTWEDVKEALKSVQSRSELVTPDDSEFMKSPGKVGDVVDFDSELFLWEHGKTPTSTMAKTEADIPTVSGSKKTAPMSLGQKRSMPTMKTASNLKSSLKSKTPASSASSTTANINIPKLENDSRLLSESKLFLEELSNVNKALAGRPSIIPLDQIPHLGDGPIGSTSTSSTLSATLTQIFGLARQSLDSTSTELARLDAKSTSSEMEIERTNRNLGMAVMKIRELEERLQESEKRFVEVSKIAVGLQRTLDVLLGLDKGEEKGNEKENDDGGMVKEFERSNVRNRISLRPLHDSNVN
ncbi:hypothetical protein HDU97_004230 [Phlyctochytrium planicorne]|nr:hypothetical protein HDU97_004230 [Phlyctochytrium planicorne]